MDAASSLTRSATRPLPAALSCCRAALASAERSNLTLCKPLVEFVVVDEVVFDLVVDGEEVEDVGADEAEERAATFALI